MPRDRESYLGDGAYVYHDGFGVVLYTSDGIRETNRVVLEPNVLAEFKRWLMHTERAHAKATTAAPGGGGDDAS
jgi:hypothetical protein